MKEQNIRKISLSISKSLKNQTNNNIIDKLKPKIGNLSFINDNLMNSSNSINNRNITDIKKWHLSQQSQNCKIETNNSNNLRKSSNFINSMTEKKYGKEIPKFKEEKINFNHKNNNNREEKLIYESQKRIFKNTVGNTGKLDSEDAKTIEKENNINKTNIKSNLRGNNINNIFVNIISSNRFQNDLSYNSNMNKMNNLSFPNSSNYQLSDGFNKANIFPKKIKDTNILFIRDKYSKPKSKIKNGNFEYSTKIIKTSHSVVFNKNIKPLNKINQQNSEANLQKNYKDKFKNKSIKFGEKYIKSDLFLSKSIPRDIKSINKSNEIINNNNIDNLKKNNYSFPLKKNTKKYEIKLFKYNNPIFINIISKNSFCEAINEQNEFDMGFSNKTIDNQLKNINKFRFSNYKNPKYSTVKNEFKNGNGLYKSINIKKSNYTSIANINISNNFNNNIIYKTINNCSTRNIIDNKYNTINNIQEIYTPTTKYINNKEIINNDKNLSNSLNFGKKINNKLMITINNSNFKKINNNIIKNNNNNNLYLNNNEKNNKTPLKKSVNINENKKINNSSAYLNISNRKIKKYEEILNNINEINNSINNINNKNKSIYNNTDIIFISSNKKRKNFENIDIYNSNFNESYNNNILFYSANDNNPNNYTDRNSIMKKINKINFNNSIQFINSDKKNNTIDYSQTNQSNNKTFNNEMRKIINIKNNNIIYNTDNTTIKKNIIINNKNNINLKRNIKNKKEAINKNNINLNNKKFLQINFANNKKNVNKKSNYFKNLNSNIFFNKEKNLNNIINISNNEIKTNINNNYSNNLNNSINNNINNNKSIESHKNNNNNSISFKNNKNSLLNKISNQENNSIIKNNIILKNKNFFQNNRNFNNVTCLKKENDINQKIFKNFNDNLLINHNNNKNHINKQNTTTFPKYNNTPKNIYQIRSNHSTNNGRIVSPNKSRESKNVIIIKENYKEKRINIKPKNQRRSVKSVLMDVPKKQCSICHQLIETHLLKIHFNSHPSKIFNWLYLGTFLNACDINELKRIGINYILNCAAECQNFNLPNDIKELHLNIRDENAFYLIPFFEEANIFMNKVRMSGDIMLIHCKFGISRSVSFIIAYMVKYFGFNVENSLNYIKKRRKQINPNEGFLYQLFEYEKKIRDKKKN